MRRITAILVLLFLYPGLLSSQVDSTTISSSDSLEKSKVVPGFSTTLSVLEDDAGNNDASGFLQNSKDVYSSVAGFSWGAATRYRIRGYSSSLFAVSMNGVGLNNPETGGAIWAFWGGLNDISRYSEGQIGLSASPYNFGGIGGYSNINGRASSVAKGSRVSYALTNRSYNHRTMVTHGTGMMDNGFAMAISLSKRWSEEGYIEGTYYNGVSYFLSLEKKINKKHSIGLVGYGAPTVKGMASYGTQEVYDLTGNNYYNSYWGYQNGKKRNSRIRNTHRPRVMLNHYFNINEKTTINSSLSYEFGGGGLSRLNWYNAADPRPDYYRNLPSYYNVPGEEIMLQELTSLWENNNPSATQLDFDQMYFANNKNIYTQLNANGIDGNNETGNRAKYMIENDQSDVSNFVINTAFRHKKSDALTIAGGITANKYKRNNYKEIKDLLGADFWVDVDQFAERDFADEASAQSDLNNPNRIVREGDRFGYDYNINIDTYKAFGQVEGSSAKIDWFAGISIVSTSFWRTGNYKNGLFPDNSYGDSEKHSFLNYGIKAGAIYKITGRHLIRLNGAYLTQAPFTRNAYVSPRTRDQIIPELVSAQIMSSDISYLIRSPKVKTRLTFYHTVSKDNTWSRSFYHDELNTFVNYMMTGMDLSFTGVEFGAEINIISNVAITAAFGTGQSIYDSRPSATIVQDNSTELLAENKTIYFKNYKLANAPQTAAELGLIVTPIKNWMTGLEFNYFADIYVGANPDRRTEEAIAKYISTDPQINEVIDQGKLDNDYTLNFFVTKSFRIKNKYYLRLNLNVNNVLNNKEFRTRGYEQLRYDQNDMNRFPPKYSYMLGRTYFAMISFLF